MHRNKRRYEKINTTNIYLPIVFKLIYTVKVIKVHSGFY